MAGREYNYDLATELALLDIEALAHKVNAMQPCELRTEAIKALLVASEKLQSAAERERNAELEAQDFTEKRDMGMKMK